MNAFEIPAGQFTLNASTAVPWHRFVKVDNNGGATLATKANDAIVGISYVDAKATQPLSIVGAGLPMVEASEAIAAGDMVVPTTDGKAAKATAPTDTNARTAGFFAITSATAAGDLITIKL